MSCLLQLRFILKRAFSLIGETVSPHFLVSLNSKPQHPILPLLGFCKRLRGGQKSFHEWMKPQDDFGAPVDCFSPCVTLWTSPLLVMSSSVGLTLMTSSLYSHFTGHFLLTCQWPWGHLKRPFPLWRLYKSGLLTSCEWKNLHSSTATTEEPVSQTKEMNITLLYNTIYTAQINTKVFEPDKRC